MSKLEIVNSSVSLLDGVQRKQEVLLDTLLEIENILRKGLYLSDIVIMKLKDALDGLDFQQEEFETLFRKLNYAPMPDSIEKIRMFLLTTKKEMEEKESESEIINIFLNCVSDDSVINAKLQEEQLRILDAVENREENFEAYQSIIQTIKLFVQVLMETEDKKRFELSLPLIMENQFDSGIIFELQYQKIRVLDNSKTFRLYDDMPMKDIAVSENVELSDVKIVEQEADSQVSIEKSEEAGSLPLEIFANVEDPEMELNITSASKSTKKFGVKEFKNFLQKSFTREKLKTLFFILHMGSISLPAFSQFSNSTEDSNQLVINELYQAGYISCYTLGSYTSIYLLNPRGVKAFKTQESLRYLKQFNDSNIYLNYFEEKIEKENILVNIISLDFFRVINMLNPDIEFNEYKSNGFFCVRYVLFPNVLDETTATMFVSITAQKKELFDQLEHVFVEYFENCDEPLNVFVVGKTLEHARAVANWIRSFVPDNQLICFLEYQSEKIYVEKTNEYFENEDYISAVCVEEGTLEEKKVCEYSEVNDVQEESDVQEVPEEKKESEAQEVLEEKKESKVQKVPDIQKKPDVQEVFENNISNKTIRPAVLVPDILEQCRSQYLNWLKIGKNYAATVYLKDLSQRYPVENEYLQLAYALNDPLEQCEYTSDQIFSIYFGEKTVCSEYFVLSAVLRNYFLDQLSFDYRLSPLQDAISNYSALTENIALNQVMYRLLNFKTDNNCGIDRYADYREKERTSWEDNVKAICHEASECYEAYVQKKQKETTSNRRYIETRKLVFDPKGDLAECLKAVINNSTEFIPFIEEFVKEQFIKNSAKDISIQEMNIDSDKIDELIDSNWNRVRKTLVQMKQTSKLMSNLRNNLYKNIKSTATILCKYLRLMQNSTIDEQDSGLVAYKKIKDHLIQEIDEAIQFETEKLKNNTKFDQAGKHVLTTTLKELRSRLDGSYEENTNRFFYIDFLRTTQVLLDDKFFPILNSVDGLPELDLCARIKMCLSEPELTFFDRLEQIYEGQDDYGSGKLILTYLNEKPEELCPNKLYNFDESIIYSSADAKKKLNEFYEDLELAESYGKLDSTESNQKDTITRSVEYWFEWAMQTCNFGFFNKILDAFRSKINSDAEKRALELRNTVETLTQDLDPDKDEETRVVLEKVDERINCQNYAAAEDLLNRLATNDLSIDFNFMEQDYFEEFLSEYDTKYRKTAKTGSTLRSLIRIKVVNKDTKGAERLLENWPKGNNPVLPTIKILLTALGFGISNVREQRSVNDKWNEYFVLLKKPQNGRKSNYTHPIAAFGSEAEEKGFRVVLICGKMDALNLIDACKTIGNAKNTLIILDYSLPLAERRKLARKMKLELTEKVFAIIDRVVLAYLADHYSETAVNRMLMSIVMPFSYYQPYIEKSVDIMPQEIFMGRKNELDKIESPTGVNIVYGGRQLGKSALLRMAQKDINYNENGDRAVLVDVKGLNYQEVAQKIADALYDEDILSEELTDTTWQNLARAVKKRLRTEKNQIPYLLLMLDEADAFIESCVAVEYKPFDALKDIQSIGSGRFKFVVAGLRNIVRFKKDVALGNNSVLAHLDSLTVTPFKSTEARELLEIPLYYLGFRFEENDETEVLISTILGSTNYFPGLLQLYCSKLIESMKKDYAGYPEGDTPPYIVQEEHIKKALSNQSLQEAIREKFFITLKVDEDDYYYILALLIAYYHHTNKNKNGCTIIDIIDLAKESGINKVENLEEHNVKALLDEMIELNVLQMIGQDRYRFARHSFLQMMGTEETVLDSMMNYME